MEIPSRATIAARAMAGDPLGIPVWVKRRGNDKAAAIIHQWYFTLNEPGEELTIVLDANAAPVAGARKRTMTPEQHALNQQEWDSQLAAHNISAKGLKKAAKAARKQTLIENTSMIKHRIDVGWTLLASITITAFSVLAMFGKLPFGW